MKTTLKAICDSAFYTQDSKKLNIIGIFERIVLKDFPAVHPQLSAVFSFEGEPGEGGEYYFDITDSQGVKIADTSDKSQKFLLGVNGRLNLIINLSFIKFSHSGVYKFNLYNKVSNVKEQLEFEVLELGK